MSLETALAMVTLSKNRMRILAPYLPYLNQIRTLLFSLACPELWLEINQATMRHERNHVLPVSPRSWNPAEGIVG